MKIVIDARESGTSTGRYVDKLVEYLHKLRPQFEVIVLTKSSRLSFVKTLVPGFKTVRSDFKEFTFSEQLGYLQQLRKFKSDLVHFTLIQQPILYKGKAVTTIHDLTTVRFNNPSKNKIVFKFKQQVFRLVIKRVARKSEHIITASEFVKKDIAQFANISPGKITVIYEAADKITEAPKPVHRLAGKQFIMYVGRPTPHKNLERLVEAFGLLKQKHTELMLVLAGKYDSNYRRIGGLVTERRLAGSVVFTDFITEGELRWLYENTTAYVFPSLSEGFGLPGLEAMVHGAPVISSNATCLPEIYGKAALYFNPKDIKAMAAKISQVISSPGLRAEMIKRGRVQASKYSWQTTAKQTLDVYSKILTK